MSWPIPTAIPGCAADVSQRVVTQRELARSAGVSLRGLIKTEQEKQIPQPMTQRRIAAALGVKAYELFGTEADAERAQAEQERRHLP